MCHCYSKPDNRMIKILFMHIILFKASFQNNELVMQFTMDSARWQIDQNVLTVILLITVTRLLVTILEISDVLMGNYYSSQLRKQHSIYMHYLQFHWEDGPSHAPGLLSPSTCPSSPASCPCGSCGSPTAASSNDTVQHHCQNMVYRDTVQVSSEVGRRLTFSKKQQSTT